MIGVRLFTEIETEVHTYLGVNLTLPFTSCLTLDITRPLGFCED